MLIPTEPIYLFDDVGKYPTLHGYRYTSEYQGDYNELVYLRARQYSPSMGRFLSRDTWGGDDRQPVSYNAWLYGYANPITYTDPSGFSPTTYGIDVDDNFTQEERSLILETISDYVQLFGGKEIIARNLALSAIKQGWTEFTGAYNARYDFDNQTITLQPGWFSPVMTVAPNGQALIILEPPCLEDMFHFPKGSMPTDKIGAKFVLAHEMGHAFAFGNPDSFSSFKNNVDLPWSIFAGFSSNPIFIRNAGRDGFAGEVFADVMAAYLYSQGLLNQQMSDWVETKMPSTLK